MTGLNVSDLKDIASIFGVMFTGAALYFTYRTYKRNFRPILKIQTFIENGWLCLSLENIGKLEMRELVLYCKFSGGMEREIFIDSLEIESKTKERLALLNAHRTHEMQEIVLDYEFYINNKKYEKEGLRLRVERQNQ